MNAIIDVFFFFFSVQDNPSALRPPVKFNRLERPFARMLEEIFVAGRTDEIITISSCCRNFTSLTKEVK